MANNNFKVRNGIDIGPVTGETNTTIDGATGDVSTIGQFTSTQANDATTGQAQIYLNGATGNRIDFNGNGLAVPATTTRSAGTKIVLFPSLSASLVDYAIGTSANTIWTSLDANSATKSFQWYGGTTEIANLNGVGDLQIDGDLTVTGNDIKSSTATAITLSGADVTILGDLTVTGNDIKSSTATAITLSGADVTILGDLTVSGTTTTIDTANLLVEDKNITIGNVASPTDTTAAGGGITLLGATNKTITWNNATDGWEFNQAITATSFTVDSRASIDSSTLTTTSTATVTLINTGRTAMSVMITAVQGANVHCVNATVLKTGASTAMLTTYGEMYNTSSLVSFTADVSGGITRLLITPTSATSTVFNAVRTSLD